MRYLKTNTATTITVGPFLDKTDGITPETSITVTGVHITFMVDNAGTPTLAVDADATASGGNNDMVHVTNDDAGYYTLELTAANTNYLGGALLSLNVVGTACPVFHEFTILPANIYDSMIAGTDLFDVSTTQFNGSAVTASSGIPAVNATQISGDSTAADNLENAFDETAGPVPWMGIIDQGTAQSASSTGLVLRSAAAFGDNTLVGATLMAYGSNQGFWQSRTITASALSGDSVTVDTWNTTPSGTITYKIFASGPASTSSPVPADVTKWAGTAVATPSVAGVPEVDLTHVAGSTTNVSALATNVDAILTDTAVIGSTGQGLTSLATQASVNTIDDFLDTEVAAILADTNELQTDLANGGRLDLLIDAIKAKTDSLTFTVAGQVDANIQSVNDVTVTGDGGSGTEWGP